MAESGDPKQMRILAKINEIEQGFGSQINDLLKEINKSRLKGKGKITAGPAIEGNAIRWTLAWKEHRKISFDLTVIANVEDDGQAARIGRVWIHRHASTPMDFEGHTPTTRMRRLATLSLPEIKQAIDAEWG